MKKIIAISILTIGLFGSLSNVNAEDLNASDLDSIMNEFNTTDTGTDDTVKVNTVNSDENTEDIKNNGEEVGTPVKMVDIKINKDGYFEQFPDSKNFIIKAITKKDSTIDELVKDFKLNSVEQKIEDIFSIRYVKDSKDETVVDNKTIIPEGSDIYLLAKEDGVELTDYPVFAFTVNDNMKFLEYGEVKLDGTNEMVVKGKYVYETVTDEPVEENSVKTEIMKKEETGVTENILFLSILLAIMSVYIVKRKEV